MGESKVGGNEQDREPVLTAGRNGAVARFPQETNIEDIGPQWLTLNGSELDTEYKQVSVVSGRLVCTLIAGHPTPCTIGKWKQFRLTREMQFLRN